MRIVLAALAIALCGCTMFSEIHQEQQLDNWAKDNERLAESGKIAWSDYYSQYLQKASATPMNDQGLVVERLGILVTASVLYERGRLDKAGFESIRDIFRAYGATDDPAANNVARETLVRALREKETAASPESRAAPQR